MFVIGRMGPRLPQRLPRRPESSHTATQLINGNNIAKTVKRLVKAEVTEGALKYGRSPCLGVVLVGNRPDSARCVHSLTFF